MSNRSNEIDSSSSGHIAEMKMYFENRKNVTVTNISGENQTKLSLVASMPEQNSTSTMPPTPESRQEGVLFPGSCASTIRPCTKYLDMACSDSKYNNNTHHCICTHTGTPMIEVNSTCERRIVPIIRDPLAANLYIFPNTPPKHPNTTRIKAVLSWNKSPTANSTNNIVKPEQEVPSDSTSVLHFTTTPTFQLVVILAFSILILSLIIAGFRRRRRFPMSRVKNKDRKVRDLMSLSKELPFDEERYKFNPLYKMSSVASTERLPVPILTRDSVTFDNEIGQGCFGKVYKGELLTRDGLPEVVAIKVLKDNASIEAEEDFMREVEIMSSFQHKNILSLLGVVPKEPGKKPWMVFEFMPHGDLAEVLRINSGLFKSTDSDIPTLSKDQLLEVSKQIAAGMEYLADQRFVHRDLACRNCLVGNNLTVKIADFGMSRDVYTCDYYKIGGSRLLPVRWMSPESVIYGRFTLESDVWSFGVLLWEIYSLGKQPYFGHNNEEVIKLILQGIMLIPPDNCPRTICEIMSLCWKTEPRDRIKFSEICDKLNKPIKEEEEPLPRPPALPIATDHLSTLHRHRPQFESMNDLMDEENYLQPQYSLLPTQTCREYLQPLPS